MHVYTNLVLKHQLQHVFLDACNNNIAIYSYISIEYINPFALTSQLTYEHPSNTQYATCLSSYQTGSDFYALWYRHFFFISVSRYTKYYYYN